MVCASTPDYMKEDVSEPVSQFRRTVTLTAWWLVKVGNGLAVAGYAYGEEKAKRSFSSAPILKRYDVFTLETTDEICVILKGIIDKDRTIENGFSSDVFRHFVFGFPLYWKEYIEKCIGIESSSGLDPVTERISPGQEREGGQPHVDGCEQDFRSPSTVAPMGMKKSKKTKFAAVSLPEKSHHVIAETPKQVEDLNKVRTWGRQKKAKNNPPVSSHTLDNAENEENVVAEEYNASLYPDKTKRTTKKAKNESRRTPIKPSSACDEENVVLEKYNVSLCAVKQCRKSRRELAYETPEGAKEELPNFSPQSMSLKRSRSGRLLMPRLQFWRNQRAIYDADHTTTGIQEPIPLEHPIMGSGSKSRRKRR